MKPFFSVVISVYNKERYIADTLQSVLDQTFEDFEVIIVNDGSSDTSSSIIETFSDQRITMITQDNQGASHARNQGILKAAGTFIALLDGDDIWDAAFLESIKKRIDEHPKQSVFASAIAHKHDRKIIPVPYSFEPTASVMILNYFEASVQHTVLSGSSTVFRKNILDKTGVFDTKLTSGEDTDLWIRIGLHYPHCFFQQSIGALCPKRGQSFKFLCRSKLKAAI